MAVGWKTGADTHAVEVVRTPGVAPEPATIVFGGPGTSFIDSRVDNGVRYSYLVRVRDAAGNASTGTVSAVPTAAATPAGIEAPGQPGSPRAGRRGRRLIAPAGAALTAGEPVRLRWTPVRRARYYNVQLYRAGRKILSAWPTKPRYRLKPKAAAQVMKASAPSPQVIEQAAWTLVANALLNLDETVTK